MIDYCFVFKIPAERPNILQLKKGKGLRECEFSSIYQDQPNIDIYDREILRLLETEKQYLFAAYGPTDSGKSYTMFGNLYIYLFQNFKVKIY